MKKFRKIVHECYRNRPTLEQPFNDSFSEVRFHSLKSTFSSSFLQQRMSSKKRHVKTYVPVVLKSTPKPTVAKRTTQFTNNTIVIDIENKRRSPRRSVSVIDLTSECSEPRDPEVIVLDETLNQIEIEENTCRSATKQAVLPKRSNRKRRNTENSDLQIIGVRNNSRKNIFNAKPSTTSPRNDAVITRTFKPIWNLKKSPLSTINNNINVGSPNNNVTLPLKSKRARRKSRKRNFSQTLESLVSPESKIAQTGQPKGKRRKLDINVSVQPAKPRASPRLKNLSGGVSKYYENLSKAIEKVKGGRRLSVTRKQLLQNKQKTATPLKGNFLSLTVGKRKSPFLQTAQSRKAFQQHKQQNNQRNVNKCNQLKQHKAGVSPRTRKNKAQITNTHNPNPVVIDVDGKRPVAIDANNVARGHGRGDFSPRGLKICVDYFVSQKYAKNQLKVFMPSCDQRFFSADLLEELKRVCDIVLTPSRVVEGKLIKPYDDRFIVGYAVEFGAIIVSNDNYRDLIQENPEWRECIQQRLLMFSWVDDYLMFPADPLGKKGPTLDQFFRF